MLGAVLAVSASACGLRPDLGAIGWGVPDRQPVDLIFADLAEAAPAGATPAPWDFSVPTNVRPCCAFGYDLEVRLGSLALPGIRVGNLIEPDGTGEHSYDASPLQVDSPFQTAEHNGLVYTCRGGFIDVAHVRDYADWTVYLTGRIEVLLDTGGVIELPDEGGRRLVYVAAPGDALIERVGRRRLAVSLAQWLAFALSVWHEAATWHRWSAFEAFPEVASAFSPEDIYSNLIGIEIAAAIARAAPSLTVADYNRQMTRAIATVLERLSALPAYGTRQAAESVDGLWWDSKRSVPDKHLVLRRNFDLGPLVTPWIVAEDDYTTAMREAVDLYCNGRSDPVALVVPGAVAGVAMRELVRLDIRVASEIAEHIPLLDAAHPWLSQDDLGAIAAAARAENEKELGAGADRPR